MIRHPLLHLSILAALLAACNPKLELVPGDVSETTGSSAACTAPKDGTLSMTVIGADATIPSGGPFTVKKPNLRAVATVTPTLTGRNRTVDVQCKFTEVSGGGVQHDVKTLTIRDSFAPTIVPLTMDDPDGDGDPASQKVGTPFEITVGMKDRPAGGTNGQPSGLDRLNMTATPGVVTLVLASAGQYDYAGVPPGPPGGVQGPLSHTEQVLAECIDEGGATITARVSDAVGNARRATSQIECYR